MLIDWPLHMRTTLTINTREWPELWQAAYRVLEQNVVSSQLQAWIQPLILVGTEPTSDGLRVVLGTANDFSAQWIIKHFREELEKAFSQVTGTTCELAMKVCEELAVSLEPSPESEEQTRQEALQLVRPYEQEVVKTQENEPVSVSVAAVFHDAHLDPRYTFESFVVGASNQFARASAVAVAEQPGRQYNPLFLHGAPGLGKTHLLYAIGNRFLQKNPKGRVGYVSAEKFVNEMVDSLQKGRMPQFRAKFRDSYDILLIDDIQFIAKKTASEEEFFHTFNVLHSSKRQIVVTSDRPPKEIEGLEERVRTRFEWGLIADISPPEIETRIAILRAKSEREDIYLPDDVATFLASYIKSNVRELEGVLIRLQAQASLTGAEISLEMAKHELKTAIPDEGSSFTIEAIQNAVAKHFHIRVQDLKSTSRARTVALPRQIAMFLARKYTGLGYREIGQYFGGKDHSTVMHGCKKIEEEFETEEDVRELVEGIQNLL
ncbi:chromosomal replication initiator protein DnaA [Bdellovibrionota bacterium FG-1]